jgi:hypothetical protein
MAKRLNNENTVGEVLKFIIKDNRLTGGMNQISVKEAWQSLMGNGVNSYTKNVVLKGTILYVELSSAVLREELSFGKAKIIAMLNEELRQELIKEIVLR